MSVSANDPKADRRPPLPSPAAAAAALAARIRPLSTRQSLPLAAAVGRVLAEAVTLDIDSPAADVSAMDGYAFRRAEGPSLPVAATYVAGMPVAALPAGAACRVMTGALVPPGADTVVPQEHVRITATAAGPFLDVAENVWASLGLGANIRRRGENAQAGTAVVAHGRVLTPAYLATLATAGAAAVPVVGRVRVAVFTSGQEVVPIGQPPLPHQVRNSNLATLAGWLASRPWLEVAATAHLPDDLDAMAVTVAAALADADAVLLAGGVSVGLTDYVPTLLERLGVEQVFRGVAIKPGKPLLGAVTAAGQPIFGLPGNPLAALVTARMVALPVLAAMAGITEAAAPPLAVGTADCPPSRGLLWQYLPAAPLADGRVAPVATRGPGDPIGLGAATGLLEIAPGATEDSNPLKLFYPW